MNSSRALRRALHTILAAGAAALAATPAVAAIAPAAASSGCTAPPLSQPFLQWNDANLYTLAPGGDFENATGSGWSLTGGARIISTTQPNGTVGGILDLPSKSQAVSPVLCITSDYPTARLWVRNIAGSEGVFFHVSYLNAGAWTNPKNTGQFHGKGSAWTLSNPMNVQPSNVAGWQQVRFTFIAGGTKSRFQVNDFWVDPRMKG